MNTAGKVVNYLSTKVRSLKDSRIQKLLCDLLHYLFVWSGRSNRVNFYYKVVPVFKFLSLVKTVAIAQPIFENKKMGVFLLLITCDVLKISHVGQFFNNNWNINYLYIHIN